MADDKILTRHPLGKSGRQIRTEYYETLKGAILAALEGKELTQNELLEALDQQLSGTFAGNVGWYGETVKLDLEARKVIERTTTRPARYRLKKT